MRKLPVLLGLALLSGCAIRPLTEMDARRQEHQREWADREGAIAARAESLQREGLDERTAHAAAESSYLPRGPRNP